MSRVPLKRTGFKRANYEGPKASPVGKVSCASTTVQPEGVTMAKKPPMRSKRYKAWIRTQPCCARKLTPCEGDVQASHHPPKMHGSISMKTSDGNLIPLCFGHHEIDFGGSQTIGGQTAAQTELFIRKQVRFHWAKWQVIEMVGGTEPWIEEAE